MAEYYSTGGESGLREWATAKQTPNWVVALLVLVVVLLLTLGSPFRDRFSASDRANAQYTGANSVLGTVLDASNQGSGTNVKRFHVPDWNEAAATAMAQENKAMTDSMRSRFFNSRADGSGPQGRYVGPYRPASKEDVAAAVAAVASGAAPAGAVERLVAADDSAYLRREGLEAAMHGY